MISLDVRRRIDITSRCLMVMFLTVSICKEVALGRADSDVRSLVNSDSALALPLLTATPYTVEISTVMRDSHIVRLPAQFSEYFSQHYNSGDPRCVAANSVYETALNIANSPLLNHNLGWITAWCGQLQLSANLFRKAIAGESDEPLYRLSYALLMETVGNELEASQAYGGAIALEARIVRSALFRDLSDRSPYIARTAVRYAIAELEQRPPDLTTRASLLALAIASGDHRACSDASQATQADENLPGLYIAQLSCGYSRLASSQLLKKAQFLTPTDAGLYIMSHAPVYDGTTVDSISSLAALPDDLFIGFTRDPGRSYMLYHPGAVVTGGLVPSRLILYSSQTALADDDCVTIMSRRRQLPLLAWIRLQSALINVCSARSFVSAQGT